jgi:serine/threonine protein kinase
VKLIDFGIAKASAVGMQTQSFSVKGKFAYMAPEYVSVGQIDSRADIFAAGVIAHELLTGKGLFSTTDDLDTLSRMLTMPIDPPSRVNPRVPEEIDGLVLAALARDPGERWSEASAMRSALATVTKRLGLGVVGSQLMQWTDDLFDDARAQQAREVPRMHTPQPFAAVTAPAERPPPGPATWLDDTNVNQMLHKAPRGATGAEPLWDSTRRTAPEPILASAPGPGVAMVVEKKPHNRLLVIATVAIGLLVAAAAVGLLLL